MGDLLYQSMQEKAARGRFYVFIINLVQSHNLNTVYAYTQNC